MGIDILEGSYKVFFFGKIKGKVLREVRGGLGRGSNIRKVALKVIAGSFKAFWNGT